MTPTEEEKYFTVTKQLDTDISEQNATSLPEAVHGPGPHGAIRPAPQVQCRQRWGGGGAEGPKTPEGSHYFSHVLSRLDTSSILSQP